MKRIFVVVFTLGLMITIPLAAETVEGILMDKMCSSMVAEKGFPAAKMHTKECALMPNCVASGYGVVTPAGEFYKFDSAGDKKASETLKQTDKKDNLTVTVEGKIEGDNIKVKSLKLT